MGEISMKVTCTACRASSPRLKGKPPSFPAMYEELVAWTKRQGWIVVEPNARRSRTIWLCSDCRQEIVDAPIGGTVQALVGAAMAGAGGSP